VRRRPFSRRSRREPGSDTDVTSSLALGEDRVWVLVDDTEGVYEVPRVGLCERLEFGVGQRGQIDGVRRLLPGAAMPRTGRECRHWRA